MVKYSLLSEAFVIGNHTVGDETHATVHHTAAYAILFIFAACILGGTLIFFLFLRERVY